MKKERGITLVALVVTVIIMLILSGVSVSFITGGEGMLARTGLSANKYGNTLQTEAEIINAIIRGENISGSEEEIEPTNPDIPKPDITPTYIPETNINPSIYNGGKGVKVEITDNTNSGYQLQYSTEKGIIWDDYIAGETEIYVSEYKGTVFARLYDSENYATGASASFNVTNIDTLAPEEFSYTEGRITATTITISGSTNDTVNTDVSASSSIQYKYAIQSTNTEPEWESIEATTETEKTFENVTATGEELKPKTKYYVYMLAIDEAGNITKAGNNGTEITTKEKLNFTKANGVIDIVWLNTDNTVRTEEEGPLSPKEHLGELTAVKYDGIKWETVDVDNGSDDWYNYEVQTGNTEAEGTSQWANAKIEKDGKTAWFVWIPRYAYKITYFDTLAHADAYRTSGSTDGILGYSTMQGIVDVTSGKELIEEGTEPTNVTGTVKTSGYEEYIPHPAFEFNGPEAGIWVGKYEASGTKSSNTNITSVEIKENASSLRSVSASAIFTGCIAMKTTYELSGDTHMMKSIEWGAVAYLTESKYGRNGTNVTQNKDTSYITGGKSGNITANKLQSSTGNESGIYDLSGGSYEYIAGYVDNGKTGNVSSLVEADPKYKDVYVIGKSDSATNNYQANKGMKGDAIYETSTSYTGKTSWHGDYSNFPYGSYPTFPRSGNADTGAGVFGFSSSGGVSSGTAFRVVLVS